MEELEECFIPRQSTIYESTLLLEELKTSGTKEGWFGKNYCKSENGKQEHIKDNWVTGFLSAKAS